MFFSKINPFSNFFLNETLAVISYYPKKQTYDLDFNDEPVLNIVSNVYRKYSYPFSIKEKTICSLVRVYSWICDKLGFDSPYKKVEQIYQRTMDLLGFADEAELHQQLTKNTLFLAAEKGDVRFLRSQKNLIFDDPKNLIKIMEKASAEGQLSCLIFIDSLNPQDTRRIFEAGFLSAARSGQIEALKVLNDLGQKHFDEQTLIDFHKNALYEAAESAQNESVKYLAAILNHDGEELRKAARCAAVADNLSTYKLISLKLLGRTERETKDEFEGRRTIFLPRMA